METDMPANATTPAHTAGPWHIDAEDTTGRPLILWSKSGQYVARVDAFPIRGHQENAANARLIAAAPEMLAVIGYMEDFLLLQNATQNEPTKYALAKVRAIIAKATA
jgi:hypothetical protein